MGTRVFWNICEACSRFVWLCESSWKPSGGYSEAPAGGESRPAFPLVSGLRHSQASVNSEQSEEANGKRGSSL